MKRVRFLLGSILCVFFLVCAFTGQLQKKEEDRVTLIGADKLERFQKDGITYQRITGNARFLHNNTYILCDTAIWNQQDNIVDAKGRVQVIQDQTRLRGETLHYLGNDNLAEIRGPLVELFDQDDNRLRTKFLDFNTKDSIGVFYNGGSMVDGDGNVLESRTGRYFSKEKRFEFEESVEMFTDTVLLKSDFAQYQTNTRVATLTGRVHAWHTDGYLKSERGLYERDREYFRFFQNVYVQTDHQEVWTDTLFFDRIHTKGSLYGNIQVLDTTQSIILLGDEGHFEQNPQKVIFTRDPVFITYGLDDNNVPDTAFVRGDTLRLRTLPKYQVDSVEVEAAQARLRQLLPVSAALDTTAPVISPRVRPPIQTELLDTIANNTGPIDSIILSPRPQLDSLPLHAPSNALSPFHSPDSLTTFHLPDSLTTFHSPDSLTQNAPPDSLDLRPPPPLDSTEVHFIYAYPHVKAYRTNGQGMCDSLAYNTLDSTIRLYGQPVLWHENNQFSADSIQFFIQNNQISRADLFSSSFIIAQEDSLLFNQIKGRDMVGYFRNNDVYLFEVLANVEFIYCIRENDLITSLNLVESIKLAVTLKDRQPQRLSYYGHTKSNVFPLVDLSDDKRRLTHFNWRVDERPTDRFVVTQRIIRPSAAATLPQEPKPLFPFTEFYFPDQIPPPPPLIPPSLPPSPHTDTTNLFAPMLTSQGRIPPPAPIGDLRLHPIQRDTTQIDSIILKHPIIIPKDTLVPVPITTKDTAAFIPLAPPELMQEPVPVQLTRKELRLQRKAFRKEQAALRKAARLLRRQERKSGKVSVR